MSTLDENWEEVTTTHNACLTPPGLLRKAVVVSAAGEGKPVTRPTRRWSGVKGTQENIRRTTSPAMTAKYGMAKNNYRDTNQQMQTMTNGCQDVSCRGTGSLQLKEVGQDKAPTLNFSPLGLFAM